MERMPSPAAQGDRSSFARLVAWLANPRSQRLLLAAVLVAAGLLAAYHAFTSTIWYDEVITLLTLAGHPRPDWNSGVDPFLGYASWPQILSDLYHYDVHPPIYFFTVEAWRYLAGQSLASVRLFSCCCMLGSTWLVFRIASLWSLRFPALAAFLFAFSQSSVFYAHNSRAYAMAECLMLLTIYLGERGSRWTAVSAAIAVGTHYFTALAVGPLVLWYCVKNGRTNRGWSIATGLIFFALALTLLPLAIVHFTARPAQYSVLVSLPSEIAAVTRGLAVSEFPKSRFMILRMLDAFVVMIYLALGLFRSIRKGQPAAVAFLAFVFGMFVLEHLAHKSVAQMPVAYYFGLCAPFAILLMTIGAEAIPRMTMILTASAAVTVATMSLSDDPQGSVRPLVKAIRADCQNCMIVAGAGEGRGVPGSVVYEAKGLPVYVLADTASETLILDAAKQHSRVYFFLSGESKTAALEQNLIHQLRLQATNESNLYVSPPR